MGISAFNRLMGFAYFLMETAANTWVYQIRRQALTTFLGQEKERHDKGKNAGARWLQTLVKDGDDVRSLVVAVTGDRCRWCG